MNDEWVLLHLTYLLHSFQVRGIRCGSPTHLQPQGTEASQLTLLSLSRPYWVPNRGTLWSFMVPMNSDHAGFCTSYYLFWVHSIHVVPTYVQSTNPHYKNPHSLLFALNSTFQILTPKLPTWMPFLPSHLIFKMRCESHIWGKALLDLSTQVNFLIAHPGSVCNGYRTGLYVSIISNVPLSDIYIRLEFPGDKAYTPKGFIANRFLMKLWIDCWSLDTSY